ncbi:MAG TPA: condensation domain-containing protein [Oscillospiraceae bacterium]|nr:condensation domain-containing protein [Oscillospiraceae bacterium]HPF55698.1 condensation domain-containing protein [Clostridiales bacterium]HPK35729.1 condensation domain-containing protein [Oscillospiraceae bacterium]HPR75063.1 condensation domain-containing protein [Oscillospiraceae bacterium]
MSKRETGRTYYDIFGSQQLPLVQLQYSLHKECNQIVFYMIVNQQFDFELLKQAVNTEIARNDCLRIRFEKHEGSLKQYFMPEYRLDKIPILDFTGKTKQEQEAVLMKDAHTPLKTKKGEVYRFIFYRTYDGHTGIYLNISHVLADLYAVVLLFADLLEVIAALQNKTPMPRPLAAFEECLKKDLQLFNDKEELEKHRQFYKHYYAKDGPSFYAGADNMRCLNKMRRKKRDPNLRYMSLNTFIYDKSENYGIHLSAERAAPILAYCEKNGVPLQTMVYVGMRTYLSRISEETDDVTFMIAVNRRITLADKRSGGCRVNALPLRTVIQKDQTFQQAIEHTQQVQYQVLRHADYLYCLHQGEIKAMEHMSMFSWTYSMLLTCVPLSLSLPEGWHCEFGNYSNGRFTLPLYTVVVPNMNDGGLDFRFEYMVKILYPHELEALFEQSVEVMERGVANPDITIGELLHGAPETDTKKDLSAAVL